AVLEEERDSEGADQRRDPGGVTERSVGEPFHGDPQATRSEHRREEGEDEERDERQTRRERRAQAGEDAVAEEGSYHVDVAVGEVQQLQNPVDHRVAERDQRIQAPEDDPVPKKLERPGPSKRANRVDDVVEQKVQGPQALRNACGPPWWAALME